MAIRLHVVFAPLLLLTACTTATPYAPVGKNGNGYAEQRLETNRYRVSFTGNSATPRETVDNYLMYRAAEITLQNGYDYFITPERKLEPDQQRNAGRSGGGSSVGFGFGSGRGFGSGVSLGVGTQIGGDKESYVAQADILAFKGAKPANDPRAFDAREVKANLEAQIKRASGQR